MISVVHNTKNVLKPIFGWVVTVCIGIGMYFAISYLGLSISIVTTNSMVPVYNPTDIVVSLSPKIIKPEIGDAIVFEVNFAENPIPTTIHRIVDVNPDGSWETKGDANAKPDGWRVDPNNITGVAVFSAPSWPLRNPLMVSSLFFLLIIIGFWPRNHSHHSPKRSNSSKVEETTETLEPV